MTERWPWVAAFTFGLLHGFGFAGALHEVGLPQNAIPLARLFFNVGVELGQPLFIASVFTVIALSRHITRRLTVPQPAWAWRVPPNAIGSIAAFWVIQRSAPRGVWTISRQTLGFTTSPTLSGGIHPLGGTGTTGSLS